MEQYRQGQQTAEAIAQELSLSARRVRQLYAMYLEAIAQGDGARWEPGRSGGKGLRVLPEGVEALWRRMLSTRPPAPYAFVASETLRRYRCRVDRATVRRWALKHGLDHSKPQDRDAAAVRRWQCQSVGELWQLDASPHRWFGPDHEPLPMLEMIDDCSRVITGAVLYPRECLMAYLHFLRSSFEAYGLPLKVYVDYHSLFFTHLPDSTTYLGDCLRFYGMTFRYAPTPQAKGKIERHHQFWQNRKVMP